jgi:tRNA(fMet)-specific endonuclease VapC
VRHLLDTNILIYLIKNRPASVAERLNALPAEDRMCMSFITWAELLKGAERSTRRDEVRRRLETLALEVPVEFAVAPAMCEHYAVQSTRLKAAGKPIGGNDLWIACHALSLDATLVTNNEREFERIVGLRLANWALA